LLGHVDRLYLSTRLNASDFGIYFLISTLVLSVLHAQLPIQRAFAHRFANSARSVEAQAQMLRVTALLITVPVLIAAYLSDLLLTFWLSDFTLDPASVLTLRLGLIAAALLPLAAPATTTLLYQNRYRALFVMAATSLGVQVITLIAATQFMGMAAGTLALLVAAIVQGLLAIWFVFRRE
jgi:O-antigen/teichoic acid export membrane protein